MKRLLPLIAMLGVGLTTSASFGAPAEPSWVMPRPPYPAAAVRRHEHGVVKLKLITDKTGRVVKVVASMPAKPNDIPNLAQGCVRWALAHWSGPPNSTRDTEARFEVY